MKPYLALLLLCLIPAGARASGVGTVHVVTLNLYHDKADWPKRRAQIVERLRELRPDAIALQEVLQHETLANQAEWLADALGYEAHFVSTDPPGKARRYGNALLTRHPVLARGERRLRPLDDSRNAGLLRIDFHGRAINIYVTHLHWTDRGGVIRRRQVEDLVDYIDRTSAGAPSLVLGDFNAAADAPELALLRKDFADAYGALHADADAAESSSLNQKYFAPKRIDHVFVQRDAFAPVSAAIILDKPDANGVWASDHYGVRARLRLTAPE
jgi:beta-glucosidase